MTHQERHQRLAPFSIEQRVFIALAALRFFQPLNHASNCSKVGVTRDETAITPFSSRNFLRFLEVPGELPSGLLTEPDRHFQRITELLNQLVRVGYLSEMGQGRSPLAGGHYYAMRLATQIEGQGCLYLAQAFGAQFLHWAYRTGTYQITGSTSKGDIHAGTGIAIAPRWLLTCAHVLKDMKIDEVQSSSQGEYKVIRQLTHPTIDVGLLEVDRDIHVVQGINFRHPHVGERVYTFGYPRIPLSREAAIVMQGGEVSVEQVTGLHGDELFLFSAIARPGNSGGPILSEAGHIVGIVTQELTEDDPKKPPFHAGIATATLAKAVQDLNCGIQLPLETWQ